MQEQEKEKWKRYAFEGYVNAQDEWYWKRTMGLVKKEFKKTATLAVINAAVSICLIITVVCILLRM